MYSRAKIRKAGLSTPVEIEREWYMKYLPCERLHGVALDNSQIEAITYNK